MGRQIQIGTTEKDIFSITSFLNESFNCILYRSFSSTKEQLIIDKSNSIFSKNSTQIYIYNTGFKWQPIIKQTQLKEKLYYIENKSTGPLIEISKSNWNPFEPGRIYWSKETDPVYEYNMNEFEIFYNEIIIWIKKHSSGIEKRSYGNIYFLDDAWKQFKNMN